MRGPELADGGVDGGVDAAAAAKNRDVAAEELVRPADGGRGGRVLVAAVVGCQFELEFAG